MFSFDTVTRLIVGSAAAECSEYKRLERKYKHVEANLKLVREVTKASTTASSTHLRNTNSIRSGPITSASSPTSTQGSDGAGPDEANLQRTQSTPAVTTVPSGSLDDLKRTYSEPGIAIPWPQMTGFGGYRRAVDASASWQLNYLEQRLKLDGDIIAGFLGEHNPPVGIDLQIWQQYLNTKVKVRAKVQRRWPANIVTTSASSGTLSSTPPGTPITDASSEYTDPVTGTRVVRGFTIADSTTISNTSSAASSYNKNKKCGEGKTVGDGKQGLVSTFRRVEMSYRDIGPNGAASECAISSDDEDEEEEEEGDDEEYDSDEDEDDDWEDMN
ncbi:hypothetical protein G647_06151 [Cladophialophora carrionii CBS 160.54]|uniref:Uncharacterized protein n=1 Tax=Cladophialophora carrionii CBS 160.54 TaxID=1279043 RepID=V9D5C7_9EURO|nr:uncharacterized protein G647_06151 [Cladophialophora carrionii CBS 160.54]ETI22080.1 hypothetical protein G647_06151 [Cladophialophora carrionii CBS 160.54]